MYYIKKKLEIFGKLFDTWEHKLNKQYCQIKQIVTDN